MRNEWIFGNKQILDFINNDFFVKYYKPIHYKEYDERILYYLLNESKYIDYIANATLTKNTFNKNKDTIYELIITNNLSKEEYYNDGENNINDNDDVNNDDDNNVIYEINEDINRINTLPFEKLDYGRNNHIGKLTIIIFI